MKSLILAFTVLFSVATLNAQDATAKAREAYKNHIKEQIKTLELSEQQAAKFEEISTKYEEKILAVKESDRGSGISKIKGIKESKDEEIEALLSEEQYEKYESLQKNNIKNLRNIRKKRNN